MSLVSGVTSSFASSSLVVSMTLRCNHASQSWRGHQDTLPQGISRLSSCFAVVWKDDDDDDAADDRLPWSARPPPSPSSAIQLPESRLTICAKREKEGERKRTIHPGTSRRVSQAHLEPIATRVFLNSGWTILGRQVGFFNHSNEYGIDTMYSRIWKTNCS